MPAGFKKTEYDVPQRILSLRLEQPFNEKYNTFSFLNIQNYEEFRNKHATILDDTRAMEQKAVVRVIYKWRNSLDKTDEALHARVPAISRVLARRVSNHCIRTWHARAATCLAYNCLLRPSIYKSLKEVSLTLLFTWARLFSQEFQSLIDGKELDAQDLLSVFTRVALIKHCHNARCVTTYKPQAGEEFKFLLSLPSVPIEKLEPDALQQYSKDCCHELGFFVSLLNDERDRCILNKETIAQIWNLYLYSVHQRKGDSMKENPYLSDLELHPFIIEQFSYLYGAVLRLYAVALQNIVRWREERIFPCSAELEQIWLNRIECLRKGLECGYFMHRMMRQHTLFQIMQFKEEE